MRKTIAIIGSSSAGMMVSHCIAAALLVHPIVIVTNSHELAQYKEDIHVNETLILYPAPQVEKIVFEIFGPEKTKHDEMFTISLASLIHKKNWYHPLWNKPP